MPFLQFTNIRVTGIACAVPKNIVKVENFRDVFGEEEIAKFIEMTGVRESRRTSEYQTASDLGFTAADTLLEWQNIDRNEIGALVFGTSSPDFRRPASAFLLHKRLGISTEAAVFDINLGCSSLVYGIQVVASLMNSSDIRKALLVVGDTAGKTTNPKDRASIMLIGEGSAALLLEKAEGSKPIFSLLRSDGNGYRYLIVPGGGYRNLNASRESVVCTDGNERSLHNSFMKGTAVFTFTIFDVPKIIRDFWKMTNTTVDDYDCFAFHQANGYILSQIAKKLRIPGEKMPLTLGKYGNTSGPSQALSLCDRYGGEEHRELRTMICGFGVGLSWGVSSVFLNTSDILPVIEDDSFFEEAVFRSPLEL